jgi:CheY-like chemotaxis protein
MDATLLIAGDPSASRETMERFFADCGFRVEVAGDGLECLDKVRSSKPDVLVVDLETPWGGAGGVVAFLHESCCEFDVPAILIVGREPSRVIAERTGVPESACFQEPLRMETLLDRVGLAVALIDLRRNETTRRRNGRRTRSAFARRGGTGTNGARHVPPSGTRRLSRALRPARRRWG